jgi:hypothetical protein
MQCRVPEFPSLKFFNVCAYNLLKLLYKCRVAHYNAPSFWGYSSAGRALAWHARGQRFDPAYLHQERESPSSRGLGHRPFTAITRVRISLGTPVCLVFLLYQFQFLMRQVAFQSAYLHHEDKSPSSRGLGHRPFTAITRVRISLGTPLFSDASVLLINLKIKISFLVLFQLANYFVIIIAVLGLAISGCA